MKKTYNVILQSIIGTGAAVNSKTYFYDWGIMDDVPYKLTFTYNSSVITLSTTQTASIYVNLTQPYSYIATDQTGLITNYRSDFLGSLHHVNQQTFPYLTANLNSNKPIYLEGRPVNNTFLVQILASAVTNYPFNSANYQLILSFEEC